MTVEVLEDVQVCSWLMEIIPYISASIFRPSNLNISEELYPWKDEKSVFYSKNTHIFK